MIFKPLTLFLMGTGILATTGAIAVQSAMSLHTIQAKLTRTKIAAQSSNSHTIRGKLTSTRADTASARCDQTSVRSEIREIPEELDLPIRMLKLGSTKAQGTTLGNGCSYTLTFSHPPINQLGELSYYYLVAETPTINSRSAGQYRSIPAGRLPSQYDLKF